MRFYRFDTIASTRINAGTKNSWVVKIIMYEIKTQASFDSAHFLTDYYGACENLHGHRWRVVVYLASDTLQKEGTTRDMVLDFGVFKQTVRDVAKELDHTFLVEEGSLADATIAALCAEGFTLTILPFRTTAENLARYFYERLVQKGLPVCQVEMYETPDNCAIYRAPCGTETECMNKRD